MKVFYVGRDHHRFEELRKTEPTFMAIGWDKWDDYSYKTLLPCRLVVNSEEVEIPNVRILLSDSDFTANTLDELKQQGWNGEFPIPGRNYASVPSDITFYQIIFAKTDLAEARSVAENLRDAGYLQFIASDNSIESLITSPGFSDSLLREGGSRKAYADGHRLFELHHSTQIRDFQLFIPAEDGSTIPIQFKFNSDVLPYDINVLIGPNGIGKSHCLQLLVEYWLRIGRGAPDIVRTVQRPTFDEYPNISKLILISYSPFEDFILDLAETNLEDKDAYQYFGFRLRSIDLTGEQRIGISRNLPARDSAMSILRCLMEDKKFGFLPNWISKFTSAKAVLSEAIEFDSMALSLKPGTTSSNLFKTIPWGSDVDQHFISIEGKRYFLLTDVSVDLLNQEVGDAFEYSDGVTFIRDDVPVQLSSGQRLFSYIVINVLGALKANSLVVVDEPELFLHPNLEITFISLLKSVLSKFNSKAILATHSLVSVREVPANCVHVFRKTDLGKQVIHPPFETFGGNIQRISSYVFGDRLVQKPYQDWITLKLDQYGTADEFIAALQNEVNEELLMKIKKLAGDK